VFKWLEKMLTHHAAKAGVEVKTTSRLLLRQCPGEIAAGMVPM
jgi:hypothetical protein